MRELKRSIAKANMRDAGFDRLFKRTRKSKDGLRRQSVFAQRWRDFMAYNPKRNRKLKKLRGLRGLVASARGQA